MSSIELTTTLSSTSALDTPDSRRSQSSHSYRQQTRTSTEKPEGSLANNGSSLAKSTVKNQSISLEKGNIADSEDLSHLSERSLTRTQNLKADFPRSGSKVSPLPGESEAVTPINTDFEEEKESFPTVEYLRIAGFRVTIYDRENAEDSRFKIDELLAQIKKKLHVLYAVKDHLAFRKGTLFLGQADSKLHCYRIMDGNTARTQLDETKLQIWQLTPIAIATQANQAPEAVLSLFL